MFTQSYAGRAGPRAAASDTKAPYVIGFDAEDDGTRAGVRKDANIVISFSDAMDPRNEREALTCTQAIRSASSGANLACVPLSASGPQISVPAAPTVRRPSWINGGLGGGGSRHAYCDQRGMARKWTAWTMGFVATATLACGSQPVDPGSSGGSGGAQGGEPASAELRAACQVVADTWCRRLAACSPLDLEQYYATDASCRAATAAECETRLMIDGANRSAKGPQNIATKLEAMACRQIVDRVPFAGSTDQPGSKIDGSACRFNIQCASLYCETPADQVCGTCKARPDPEEHANEPCEVAEGYRGCRVPGLVCELSSETCVVPPHVGEPCINRDVPGFGPWDQCDGDGLECHEGICIEPLDIGASCTSADDRCLRQAGLACNAQGVCDIADRGPAHVEAKCGGYEYSGTLCGYDDVCARQNQDPNSDAPGQCVPKEDVGFGDACNDSQRGCPWALSCLEGTCKVRPWLTSCR